MHATQRQAAFTLLLHISDQWYATDPPFESSEFVAFIPKPYSLRELALRVLQSLGATVAAPASVAEAPAVWPATCSGT